MKKYILATIALAGLTLAVHAQVSQTSQAISTFTVPADFQESATTQINALVTDVAGLAGLVTVDTAANVDLTTKTPAAIGAILVTPNATNTFTEVATSGAATNTYLLRVAVAYGTTTNDWAKIATDK